MRLHLISMCGIPVDRSIEFIGLCMPAESAYKFFGMHSSLPGRRFIWPVDAALFFRIGLYLKGFSGFCKCQKAEKI